MKPPRQQGLFDDVSDRKALAVVSARPAGRRQTPAERAFNRLTEEIRGERERIAAWEAFAVRLGQRVAAELEPIERQIAEVQKRLAHRLDHVLSETKGGERLGRKHRTKLQWHLMTLLDQLLQGDPDPEVEALHERYSGLSNAERRALEMETAEAFIGEFLGRDAVDGHDARDVDELLHHAGRKFVEREEARVRHRRESAREKKVEERKEKALKEATGAVREVYRKLVGALHPDREVDPAERERKTRLTQRANRAYKANDLLHLLDLQFEVGQIDPQALAEMPEARIRPYNDVLREHLRAVRAEIEGRIDALAIEFGLSRTGIATEDVDQALDARIVEARRFRDTLEHDIEALDDPRRRRALVDSLPSPCEVEEAQLDRLAAVASLHDLAFVSSPFDGAPRAQARPIGPKRKKRRRR